MNVTTISVNAGNVSGFRYQIPQSGANLSGATTEHSLWVEAANINLRASQYFHGPTGSRWAVVQAESRFSSFTGSIQGMSLKFTDLDTVVRNLADFALNLDFTWSPVSTLMTVASDFRPNAPGGHHPLAAVFPVGSNGVTANACMLQYMLAKGVGTGSQQNYYFMTAAGRISSGLSSGKELVSGALAAFGYEPDDSPWWWPF